MKTQKYKYLRRNVFPSTKKNLFCIKGYNVEKNGYSRGNSDC